MASSFVRLPASVRGDFEVYINGVRQVPGTDYQLREGRLEFEKELVQEGKLGFWRWFLGAWGVGTYRDNHSVDIRYEIDGRPAVAEGLDIEQA